MHTFSFHARRTARSFGLVTVGVLSTLGVLSLSHVGPAQAQSPGVNLAQLVAQVNALQSTVTNQGNTITSQGNTITGLKSQQTADEQTISNLKTQEQIDLKNTQNQEKSDFTKLNDSVFALQTLTAPLSLSSDPNVGGTNTLLTIKGVNVQVINGKGSTETANGLGNLIVGYNENDPNGFNQARTGSHNIVVGLGHNYLSYGGLVAGESNVISGPYATVTGGYLNVASSGHDSVSGGSNNTASGGSSSISGGSLNKANANYASVSGGTSNTASGYIASVSGGYSNMASGYYAAVSGGIDNTASGNSSSVSGGYRNMAGGPNQADRNDDSSVSGGENLTESAGGGWKAGSQSALSFSTEGNFASD